jgi:hypothetical protein
LVGTVLWPIFFEQLRDYLHPYWKWKLGTFVFLCNSLKFWKKKKTCWLELLKIMYCGMLKVRLHVFKNRYDRFCLAELADLQRECLPSLVM